MTNSELHFDIPSDTQYLAHIREKLKSFLTGVSMDEKAQNDIQVVVGEACTNAIRHAYGNEAHHKIDLSLEDLGDRVVIRIRDYGKKIDLSKVREPVLPPVEPGGLGIYFMKTMMDMMEYNTELPEGNEVILTKFKKSTERGPA